MADILLLVGIALCQLALAWMGIRVTFNPIATEKEQKRFKLAFGALGLLGLILVAYSGYRTNAEMDSNFGNLGRKIDSLAQHINPSLPPATPAPSRTAYCDVPLSENRDNLIEALKVVGQQKISITSIMGNGPGFHCATDWVSLFRDAGWDVNGPNQAVFSTPMEGILISVGPAPGREAGKRVSLNALPVAAAALIRTLESAHIQFKLNLDQSMKDHPDSVALILGTEP